MDDKPRVTFTPWRQVIPPDELALFDRAETPVPLNCEITTLEVAQLLAELRDIAIAWCRRDNAYEVSCISVRKPKDAPSVILDHRTGGMIIIGPRTKRDLHDELVVYDERRYLIWDTELSPITGLIKLMDAIHRKKMLQQAWQDGMRLQLGKHGDAPPAVRIAIEQARKNATRLWFDLRAPEVPSRLSFSSQPSNDNF